MQKKLVGYSMEQMFDVVSDVKNYYQFVPFCKKSFVYGQRPGFLKADLIIGFPPLNESYTSNVTLAAPTLVRAECKDGRLFNYLLNFWKFNPGLKDIPQSCVIDFMVTFEFRSMLHSQLSNLFFDQLVKQMEHAFINEAERRFGRPVIKSHILMSSGR
jgi:coenzyme Q-binding protein COQ10